MMLRNRPPISQPIPNPPFEKRETNASSDGAVSPVQENNPPAISPQTPQVEAIPAVATPKEETTEAVLSETTTKVKLVRAKDEDGKFLPDDPSTPDVDEAWVLGVDS